MLGASSYDFEKKGKYYLHLRSTEGHVWKDFCQSFPFILVIHKRILGTFFLVHSVFSGSDRTSFIKSSHQWYFKMQKHLENEHFWRCYYKQKRSSAIKIIYVIRRILVCWNLVQLHIFIYSTTLLVYHKFWFGNSLKLFFILLDTYEQNPFLSASIDVSFLPDETQHSYSLKKATVLKLSKPICFNFTLSQSAGKILEKNLCEGKFK